MKISTSILDAEHRVDSVIQLNRTNTNYIHVDVMDGKFVSNTSFNEVNEIRAINRVSKYPLDVHLMVENPSKYIMQLQEMNIEFVTFHLEVKKDISILISKIKKLGYKVGIAIKPDTDIKKIEPYLQDIDLVLVMSVEPGRGGQSFLMNTVNRVNELKNMIKENNYSVLIEVDGGINEETIGKLENVDIFVVGSYIVKSDHYYRRIERLSQIYEKSVKDDSKNKKIKIFYKVLFWFGWLPFIFVALLILYGALLGFNYCIFNSCDFVYGIEAIRYGLVCFIISVRYFWPFYLLFILLIIIGYRGFKIKGKIRK